MGSVRKRQRVQRLQNRCQLQQRIQCVRALLSSLPTSSQNQFLFSGKGSLAGLTPVQALRRGLISKVMNSAAGFVER